MSKLSKFVRMNKYEKKLSFIRNTYSLFHKGSYKHIGKKSYIIDPIFLSGTKYISIGENCGIWYGARIEAIDESGSETFTPEFIIGNNVMIGQHCHITLAERIEIEDNVVCSARVTITDINHITSDPTIAVLNQGITTKPVRLCEGAFVGINATILPGVTIGKHAVVGSGAVVTHDVPDYATVAGVPARVISRRT